MSGANRGQGSAASSEYHNQENMLSRLRGSMKHRTAASNDNQENLPPKQAGGRTVLGALQNNHPGKAQQNQRGGKQVTMLAATVC